jgi:hypothetical protein
MRRRLWVMLASGLMACGGTAIVDGTTGNGSSSSSAASSGSGAAGASSSGVGASSSGTGASGPGAPCTTICDHAADNGCSQVDCAASCASALEDDGPCSGDLAALVDCWSDNLQPGLCAPPAVCEKEHLTFLACSGEAFDFNGCPEISAEGELPTGGCSSVACDFEGSVYVESCWCESEGEFATCTCECIKDGVVEGTCEEDGNEGCYPLAACCEFVFLE